MSGEHRQSNGTGGVASARLRTGRTQQLNFPGGAGHQLSAKIELPDGEARAFAVFAPCFTCVRDSKAIVRISRALAEAGVAVLRYDVTGIGQSEGDFADTTMTSQVDDLLAAAAHLRTDRRAPALVIGISLGGAVAIEAAARIPEAKAVVTVNAPANTAHLTTMLHRSAPRAMTTGFQEIDLLGRNVRIGRALIEDLPRHSVSAAAGALHRPLLIFHAPDDEIVPVEHGERLFAEARQPKSMISIDGSDHLLLTDPGAATWVGEMIISWLAPIV